MDDGRIWAFEESLWRASDAKSLSGVDDNCVMAFSHAPWVFTGAAAIGAVSHTPEWEEVSFSDWKVTRPDEGMIVVGYRNRSIDEEKRFSAACTSVYRRTGHGNRTVVQHAQVAPDGQF